MSSAASRLLRSGVHGTLRRLGLDLVRYDARRFPELRQAELMRERGIDLVLDVGANDGPFGRSLREAGYEGRIVSFEPQSGAFARLERAAAGDPRWECRRIAVGSSAGEALLHIAANSSSSSLLEMAPQHVASAPESRYVATETVALTALDDLRAELIEPHDRVYLKVDVQGAELDVLNGAEATLAQTTLVCVELSLVPLYEDAPTYHELIEHLGERNFGLLALEPVFVDPESGRVLQLDGFFGRG